MNIFGLQYLTVSLGMIALVKAMIADVVFAQY